MYGWNLSQFYYVLALISLIIAIVFGVFNGFQTGDLTDQHIRNQSIVTFFFLAAIALGILALAAHGYHKRVMRRR